MVVVRQQCDCALKCCEYVRAISPKCLIPERFQRPCKRIFWGKSCLERISRGTAVSFAKLIIPNRSVGFNFATAAFICLNASACCVSGMLSEVSSRKTTASRCALCVRCRSANARIAHRRAVPRRKKVKLLRHFAAPRCARRCTRIITGIAARRIKKRGARKSNITLFPHLLDTSVRQITQ